MIVPAPVIGFIGAGRVAGALAPALHRAGCTVAAVASRTPASAQRLAAMIPGCRAVTVQAVADVATLVFLTVPDDSIAGVAAAVRWRPGVAVVHCSGATELDALASAHRAGALVGGFHPLHAFAEAQLALASLPGRAVAIEASPPLLVQLEALARTLQLQPLHLPPGTRALYHLSGSFAASFIDALLHEAVELWQTHLGATREQALDALLPLARTTLDSIAQLGTVAALTGPVSRGDAGTVARHVEALRRDHPRTASLYVQLAQRSLAMAIERGGLTPAQCAALAQVLEAADDAG